MAVFSEQRMTYSAICSVTNTSGFYICVPILTGATIRLSINYGLAGDLNRGSTDINY